MPFGKLRDSLRKTSRALAGRLKALVKGRRIDASLWDDIEEVLITSDVGVEASDALDKAVFAHYPKLQDNEIKTLLVEDKWQASLRGALEAEIERVTQQLANRVKELEERYSHSLPQLTNTVSELEGKVAAHLKAMGLEWA